MMHIKPVVSAVMLLLRRRYLERQIDRPFDSKVSLELDRVIVEQEALTGQPSHAAVEQEGR